MKLKTLKLSILIIMALLFSNCEKGEAIDQSDLPISKEQEFLQNEEPVINIIYNYQYGENKFQVNYLFDRRSNNILQVEGDIKYAKEILGSENENQVLVFEPNQKVYNGMSLDVSVFDNRDEAIKSLELESSHSSAKQSNKNNCYDIDTNGVLDYHFYRHINFNDELMDLRGMNKGDYSIQWFGNNSNDQMSSFWINADQLVNGTLTLFEHSCRTGREKLFYLRGNEPWYFASDLRIYGMSGFFSPSWNDQTSSFLGDI